MGERALKLGLCVASHCGDILQAWRSMTAALTASCPTAGCGCRLGMTRRASTLSANADSWPRYVIVLQCRVAVRCSTFRSCRTPPYGAFSFFIVRMRPEQEDHNELPGPEQLWRRAQIHLMELPNPDPTDADARPTHGGRDRHVCVGAPAVRPGGRWSGKVAGALQRPGICRLCLNSARGMLPAAVLSVQQDALYKRKCSACAHGSFSWLPAVPQVCMLIMYCTRGTPWKAACDHACVLWLR